MPLVERTRRQRHWFRNLHRWLGGIAAFFVLLLAVTGIALNHGHELGLDQRHVKWDWLLDAYGIRAPAPSVSYAAGSHRATLLGGHLYLDAKRVAQNVDDLAGAAVTDGMLLLAGADSAWLVTPEGELIERLELTGTLPGPVQRAGIRNGRPVVQSAGQVFEADAGVTGFHGPVPDDLADIDWSDSSPAPDRLIETLQSDYRGEGLTLERLLADIHSGRLLGSAGPWFMDFIAVCLVLLGLTGLWQWLRAGRNARRRR